MKFGLPISRLPASLVCAGLSACTPAEGFVADFAVAFVAEVALDERGIDLTPPHQDGAIATGDPSASTLVQIELTPSGVSVSGEGSTQKQALAHVETMGPDVTVLLRVSEQSRHKDLVTLKNALDGIEVDTIIEVVE